VSCHKESLDSKIDYFMDDFESYDSVPELTPADGGRWTLINDNEINVSTNPVSIDTTIVHSGNKSVRFHCRQLDPDMNEVCKCNLNKNGIYFRQGQTIYYSAWYYVESTSDFGVFFVLDLEEMSSGTAAVSGVRIMVDENGPGLERGKIGLGNLSPDEADSIDFPVNQWVHLEMELKLAQDRHGSVRIRMDGNEIVNHSTIKTLPKDFANLVWGSRGFYDRMQVGITAKSETVDLVMYVDDVLIMKM
jgi:hypothetical protein